uniref:dTDP-4-dehydrorhamnose 3,5-epimerase n=1 Tax=Candidatus Kentrum sp. MB TaxID=2138164 RepID=A0A450XK19_9GAMM|nr:MAG: dTDP-4-dehydrorhamnose 3,5-epimerase [Candidatus Kentron sp. MB]VFK33724.1 MAG: dTDP-4-dehydrorhamnose 3,5-epimerase [Candidatus Kentron sp. MB]VFK76320.1 MAG: dTDP-4-dehydrorhamnose 3,5-epimerase [Candidatus Kentron sp. MB]
MIFAPLPLVGAFRIQLAKFEDDRGFFARSFCVKEFGKQGLHTHWEQMNISFNERKGTLRGLHFQRPPAAEVKVVRCTRGAIWDAIVDLRAGSETYGRWYGMELDSENHTMLYVPEGFAHGFQTLQSKTEIQYFHSVAYSPEHEGGLNTNDPDLKIDWPLPVSDISDRDRMLPFLKQLEPLSL